MKSETLQALADHVALEWQAAANYLYLSAWCHANNWDGTGSHFAGEATEEVGHAIKFATYSARLGGVVAMRQTAAIATIAAGAPLLACFKAALAVEQLVLDNLNSIAALARENGDEDAIRFIHEFTKAGTEQIASLLTDIAALTRAGQDMAAIQAFDMERGE